MNDDAPWKGKEPGKFARVSRSIQHIPMSKNSQDFYYDQLRKKTQIGKLLERHYKILEGCHDPSVKFLKE
jgi:hypothetical protein